MTRPLATLQTVGAVEVSSTGLPSTVAVIDTEPGVTAGSPPWAETVAMAGVLLVHTTERPVRMAPLASKADADSCTNAPAV